MQELERDCKMEELLYVNTKLCLNTETNTRPRGVDRYILGSCDGVGLLGHRHFEYGHFDAFSYRYRSL